jgi:hypothetical protein
VPRVAVLLLAVVLVAGLEQCWPRALPALVVGVAVAVAYLPWLIFRAIHGISASSEHLSQLQPQALGRLFGALVGVFAGVRTGGALLVVALTVALAGPRLIAPRFRLLSLVVLGEVLATFLAFLVSETAPDLQALTRRRGFSTLCAVALFWSRCGWTRFGHNPPRAMRILLAAKMMSVGGLERGQPCTRAQRLSPPGGRLSAKTRRH